jgi:hypothetical protein
MFPSISRHENRSLCVQQCNHDWALNAARYSELALPVPPNDCEFRTYGLADASSLVDGYLPDVTPEVLAWRAANPGGGVENAWDEKSRRILEEKRTCPET